MIKKTKNKTNKRERIFTGNGTVTRKKIFREKKESNKEYTGIEHTHRQREREKSTH